MTIPSKYRWSVLLVLALGVVLVAPSAQAKPATAKKKVKAAAVEASPAPEATPSLEPKARICFSPRAARRMSIRRPPVGENAMSLGTILVIILIIFLLGGFSGRFGGYGYGMGHSGMGLGGVILIVLIILLLLGKL